MTSELHNEQYSKTGSAFQSIAKGRKLRLSRSDHYQTALNAPILDSLCSRSSMRVFLFNLQLTLASTGIKSQTSVWTTLSILAFHWPTYGWETGLRSMCALCSV